MKEPKEVTYELADSFEYAFKGDQRKASFIILTPPTMRQHSQAAALKQSIVKIVSSGVRDSEEIPDDISEDEVITAEMVIATIYNSHCVEANIVWEQAKALFKEGVAMVDGEQKLTNPLIEKLTPEDFEKLVGEYIVNFTLA